MTLTIKLGTTAGAIFCKGGSLVMAKPREKLIFSPLIKTYWLVATSQMASIQLLLFQLPDIKIQVSWE